MATTTTTKTTTTAITMSTNTKIPARTVRRTAKDEAADLQMFEENRLRAPYEEWPNEAGFDGLTEERGPIELHVQGQIPVWAAGALYRTGPGSCKIEDTPKGTYYVSHWFDGFAQTHKFDITPPESPGGQTRVLYSSRRQSDDLVASIKAAGHQNRYTFGQKADPCVGMFGKFMGVFARGTAPNICVAVNANVPGFDTKDQGPAGPGHRNAVRSLWLSTDSSPLMEIDPATLEPIGLAKQEKLHPSLSGPMSCAHAQRDPVTGDMYNFNLAFAMKSTYRIFRTSFATGETEILATIAGPDAKPAYIHSFFLTESFIVLCIPSSHLGYKGLSVPWERNILDAIVPFDKTNTCKWYFIDRHQGNGVVASFDTPAGFFFHATNAFEEPAADGSDGMLDVYCEIAGYQNLNILYNLYYDVIMNRNSAGEKFWTDENKRYKNGWASLQRFKFRIPKPDDSQTQKITTVTTTPPPELAVLIPAPHAGELPTINPAHLTKRHRYVYSLSDRGLSTLLDTIVKTDADTAEALMWECPTAHTPGEPIFVPRPSSSAGGADGTDGQMAEDDGVILSVVLDGTAQTSYLLCLDARTMTELGRAECEFAVGIGFHGIHAPSGPGA
ncbi:carotenoid cleavage dioxygenase 1 [Colletotrichum abscissum]|uniref:Carotenoid cleavage dioxygenase 1 n=1 Tax=Colletotrichum abscissum TaxID=1671311 RepID=A0A9P9XEK5_9PEZI|nr:carotenoid cleavage dioxygenase 1 [Colletotrichum abscissum]KAI3549202.1 carotenoid cleavage dioxygenase 1 [Colletotrichum abscissum]KAK1507198.1 carotenoid cleavage dioxygenase 1 [Colletotrichum abscissum]